MSEGSPAFDASHRAPLSFETGSISRRYLDLHAPNADDVAIDDVAYGLSRIARFNGQARRVISVAEHSLVVEGLVRPPYRLAAVLHDAPEYAMGDLTSPMKRVLQARLGHSFYAQWTIIETQVARAIVKRALLDFAPAGSLSFLGAEIEANVIVTEMSHEEVRCADRAAFDLEETIRYRDSLRDGGVNVDRALKFYPVHEPDRDWIAGLWRDRVKALVAARAS